MTKITLATDIKLSDKLAIMFEEKKTTCSSSKEKQKQ